MMKHPQNGDAMLDPMIIYIYICACMYLSIYPPTYLSIYLPIYLHMYLHTCIYIYMCVCVCICIYVYIYVCYFLEASKMGMSGCLPLDLHQRHGGFPAADLGAALNLIRGAGRTHRESGVWFLRGNLPWNYLKLTEKQQLRFRFFVWYMIGKMGGTIAINEGAIEGFNMCFNMFQWETHGTAAILQPWWWLHHGFFRSFLVHHGTQRRNHDMPLMCPPVVSWFIKPTNYIVISLINIDKPYPMTDPC